MSGDSLSTTELYLLSQLLVAGRINYKELCDMNKMPMKVREEALHRLQYENIIEHTLYNPYSSGK